jgi:hypothetical protein
MLKYLLLILVVAAVWYGWRVASRKAKPKPPVVAEPPAKPQVAAEDLKPCPACGAYVNAAAAKSCGRPDCPYPQV